MSNKTKSKIFLWLYRSFSYFVPLGLSLWAFLIENLINKEVSVMSKIGVSGLFILVIAVVIGVYFYGKHFRTAISKVTNEILECLDNDKKIKLIEKKRKLEARQELFHNVCFVAPFVLVWLLCSLIEKKVISLRGIMMTISLSMAIGLGFNGVCQWFKTKSE